MFVELHATAEPGPLRMIRSLLMQHSDCTKTVNTESQNNNTLLVDVLQRPLKRSFVFLLAILS